MRPLEIRADRAGVVQTSPDPLEIRSNRAGVVPDPLENRGDREGPFEHCARIVRPPRNRGVRQGLSIIVRSWSDLQGPARIERDLSIIAREPRGLGGAFQVIVR